MAHTYNMFDPLYKILSGLRIGFSAFIILFLIGNGSYAQESVSMSDFTDPYLVENIEVDASADNAVEAREKAFEAAQIRGYEELAKRLLSAEELESFETPDINIVASFVQDYEVLDEKLSATRYKGTYNVRFDKSTFNKPAAGNLNGGTLAVSGQSELLVLPFLEMNGRYYLWQINPFWEAWRRGQANKILGKIVVPVGDPTDISQMRDGQSLSYDPASLNAMRIRYQAQNVAIAVASPEMMYDNQMNISIGLYKPQPYGPELSKRLSVRSYPAESTDQLYNRVVTTIVQALHSDWQRQTLAGQSQSAPNVSPQYPQGNTPIAPILEGGENNITAQLKFSGARQWVNTKKSIESINGVEAVQIKSLSPRSATININFLGSVDQLRAALLQQGIRLNNAPIGEIYQLSSTRYR